MKILVNNKADLHILDPVGNSVLHIAVSNGNDKALDYLLQNWPEKSLPVDLTHRNKKGETPYTIALESKNEKALKVLERY